MQKIVGKIVVFDAIEFWEKNWLKMARVESPHSEL